ncbi:MAG TPA: MBL fold metallo-hydrolase [Candidatus Deferrimicrobiaceae bacterium]|nr:MBL fold metallo-hydrolase [Candidatus Deferrimicrobiaceae bacterium]
MRLTFLGTGTARPLPDTAASGVLVQDGETAVLFDIGSGIASKLETTVGAAGLSGLVVGHFHADHWIDIAPLRYRFPWGERAPRPLPVFLPPGGRDKLEHLAAAMAERPGFFDAAFDVTEYEDRRPYQIGSLTVTPHPVGHYVPAWSMDIACRDGRRIVYAGDMGPSETLVELARGADALILEATLESTAFDDARRGHLAPEEAIEHAALARVPRAFLVHYPSERRGVIQALCTASGVPVEPAVPGLIIEIECGSQARPRRAAREAQETVSTG